MGSDHTSRSEAEKRRGACTNAQSHRNSSGSQGGPWVRNKQSEETARQTESGEKRER